MRYMCLFFSPAVCTPHIASFALVLDRHRLCRLEVVCVAVVPLPHEVQRLPGQVGEGGQLGMRESARGVESSL